MKAKTSNILIGITVISFLLGGCSEQKKDVSHEKQHNESSTATTEKEEAFSIAPAKTLTLDHIHGIGYPSGEESLFVASHHGLKIFKESSWYETNQNNHDYMGFQAVEAGFVASGHPEKGSNLKNPLGLVQSVDSGKSLNMLAFYGESDFHFLAASYKGQTHYVINEHENSKLKQGVFYSNDQGKTWSQSKLADFKSDTLGMISVHPSKGNIMAMATRNGIFYSENSGDNMELLTDNIMTTSLAFANDDLYYSVADTEKISLVKINPESKATTEVKIPFLDYTNPITYLGINQQDSKQMAFTTYENDIFETKDGGLNWTQVLKKGKAE